MIREVAAVEQPPAVSHEVSDRSGTAAPTSEPTRNDQTASAPAAPSQFLHETGTGVKDADYTCPADASPNEGWLACKDSRAPWGDLAATIRGEINAVMKSTIAYQIKPTRKEMRRNLIIISFKRISL